MPDTMLGRLRDIWGEGQGNKIDKDPCPGRALLPVRGGGEAERQKLVTYVAHETLVSRWEKKAFPGERFK